MTRVSLSRIVFLASLLVMAACSYHEDKHPLTSGVGQGGQGGGGDPTPMAQKATFSYIEKNYLGPSCVECHGPGGKASFAPFIKYSDVMLDVKKGNPNGSELMKRASTDMPPSPRPHLPPEAMEAIGTWIANGAANN